MSDLTSELRERVGATFVATALALDRTRLREVPRILRDEAERVLAIRKLLAERAPPAELEADSAFLLAKLRSARVGRALAPFHWLDRWFRSSHAELIDLPCTPGWFKSLEIENLDLQNRLFGNYVSLFHELLRVAPRGALRLHDLASGSGGFLRFVAERRLAPLDWDLCASDLLEESLERGRTRASRAGLSVRFERRDATDLRPLAGRVDVFTLQSAAHHMSPGVLLAVMQSAAQVAPGGLLIVDPVRGLGAAVLTLLACVAPVVTLPNSYDAVSSVRRAYSAAELALLAQTAGLAAFPGFMPPMFTRVWVTDTVLHPASRKSHGSRAPTPGARTERW